jgi:hypothetical protein
MAEVNWAQPREVPTPSEAEFMEVLEGLMPRTLDFDFWQDSDNGAPWMMVHLGLLGGADGDTIMRSLRLDFDSAGMRGGWSPYNMNGDAGVRAEKVGVDTSTPQGIAILADGNTPAALAQVAAEWFRRRQEEWEVEREQAATRRRRPWHRR